jgi:hypothetical protein
MDERNHPCDQDDPSAENDPLVAGGEESEAVKDPSHVARRDASLSPPLRAECRTSSWRRQRASDDVVAPAAVPTRVVCVSRIAGAGGDDIGRPLAERLGCQPGLGGRRELVESGRSMAASVTSAP